MSPGTSALHSVQELGTTAVAFLLHHPGQSGVSGVSRRVRKQNSSVKQNMLIATVFLSRGFVGLCAFNDNFFSPGSKLGKSKHELSTIPGILTGLAFHLLCIISQIQYFIMLQT